MITLRDNPQTEHTSSPWVTVASTTALSELLQLCNFKRRDKTGLLRNDETRSLIVNFLRPSQDVTAIAEFAQDPLQPLSIPAEAQSLAESDSQPS